MSALYVVLAIIALSVLMIFHEYGHYLAAKRLHYPVTAFGIGFGPNIIKKQIGETEFRVGILLFGAYVEVPAMDGEGNETIKPLHKVAIALAGPLMNFILAFLVVFVVLVSGNPLEPSAVVGSIVRNSSAAEVLQVGDKILQVDGKSINSFEDFQRIVASKKVGDEVSLVIERDDNQLTVEVEVRELSYEGETFVGVGISGAPTKYSPLAALGKSFQELWTMIKELWKALVLIISRPKNVEVMGIIGITATMASFAKANLMLFLYLVAFISANLGFINLVPFPALDGSLILVGLIESAIRRPLPKSWVNTVNIIGFVCLMGLMIYVSLLDIGRLMGF